MLDGERVVVRFTFGVPAAESSNLTMLPSEYAVGDPFASQFGVMPMSQSPFGLPLHSRGGPPLATLKVPSTVSRLVSHTKPIPGAAGLILAKAPLIAKKL